MIKWSTFAMLTFLRALSLVFNVSYFNVINYDISINKDRFEALNCCCFTTTGLTFIKFIDLNEWVYKGLYINFQVILNFTKSMNLEIKAYIGLLWYCKNANKLKELKK